MRRFLLTATALCAFLCAFAQEEKPRTGWSFISLPNLSYNSDLGLSLGAWGDLFYYGDGSQGPNFLHHLGFSGAYMTKGSWFLHAFFDSDSLIPGISLRSSATYRDVPADSFYGFNGIASPFDASLEMNRDSRTAYYTYRHRYIRVSLTGSGAVSGNLRWLGGAVFRWVQTADFDLANYDSGHSLYLDYVDRGLIRADEMGGGASLEFKAGVRYDSRDMPLTPGQGLFAQLYLLGNVCLQGGPYHYGQLVADFRQYLPLLPQRLLFAWHLGLQHTLWGEVPFYLTNELATPEYRYEDFTGLGFRLSPLQTALRTDFQPLLRPGRHHPELSARGAAGAGGRLLSGYPAAAHAQRRRRLQGPDEPQHDYLRGCSPGLPSAAERLDDRHGIFLYILRSENLGMSRFFAIFVNSKK